MSYNPTRRDVTSTEKIQPLTKVRVISRGRSSIVHELAITRIVFDALAFAFISVAWLLLKYFIKPVRRAFLCSDLNLYRPRPPKSVFPVWLLVLCAIGAPLIVMILSEIVRWLYLLRKKGMKTIYKLSIGARSIKLAPLIGNLYIFLSAFGFANVVNSFLTNVGKVAVGRLRPHFIPSCFDRYTYRDFCDEPNEWITNYTCIGESSATLKVKDGAFDIRQSFPSGHTSTAFCGLIFLALYIHQIWNHRNLGLFPYLFQMICFTLAAYIGFTRITDNRHHPTDVLAGSILGTIVAIVAFRYTMKYFKTSTNVENFDQSEIYQYDNNENDEV